MKKITLVIENEHTQRVVYDRLHSLGVENKLQITIADYKKDRSIEQNRLYRAWLNDISKTDINEHAGSTENEWHLYFRTNYFLPVYIRDGVGDYAKTMDSLRYLAELTDGGNEYQNMREFVHKRISTTEADVSQFSECLNKIELWCHGAGIYLRTDPQIYAVAMEKK
jgi:hypothetical protein